MNCLCPVCGQSQVPSTVSYWLGSKWENRVSCINHHCKHTLIFYSDFYATSDDWLEYIMRWFRSNPLPTKTGVTMRQTKKCPECRADMEFVDYYGFSCDECGYREYSHGE